MCYIFTPLLQKKLKTYFSAPGALPLTGDAAKIAEFLQCKQRVYPHFCHGRLSSNMVEKLCLKPHCTYLHDQQSHEKRRCKVWACLFWNWFRVSLVPSVSAMIRDVTNLQILLHLLFWFLFVHSETGEIDYDEFMKFVECDRSPFSGQLRCTALACSIHCQSQRSQGLYQRCSCSLPWNSCDGIVTKVQGFILGLPWSRA